MEQVVKLLGAKNAKFVMKDVHELERKIFKVKLTVRRFRKIK